MNDTFVSQVEEFAKPANVFCELIEVHNTYSMHNFLYELAKVLSELYYSGLTLPEVESVSSEAILSFVTTKERIEIQQAIGTKLGAYNLYLEIFNPYVHGEPITGNIGDDLTDIYSDIKNGLAMFKKGNELDIAEAIWHWRFSFYSHFSNHLVSALRVI